MSKRNFAPMERIREILSKHGLRMKEIGINHIRVFKDEKSLFDYYLLNMKLFDYYGWHQLTHPFPDNSDKTWENELENIIMKYIDFPDYRPKVELGTIIYQECIYPVREITGENGSVFNVSIERLWYRLLDGIRNGNAEAIELDESIFYYCTEEQIKEMSDTEIDNMI